MKAAHSRLQFLHLSVWFPLRCHLCKPVLSSNPYCCHSKIHFLLDTLFVSKRAKLRLTEKIMTLLCHELPPLPPPHLKFYLPQSRTAGVVLAACPFCTCHRQSHTSAASSPETALRVAPFSDSTIRSAHVSYLGQYISSL